MNQTTGGTGFGVTQIVVLIVPVVAGCFLLAGYLLNQIWARNERRAKAFAEALAAVENYLEMPYRVRRRPASDPETRATLTNQMSDIKAQIAFHQAWLQVEAPQVAEAYDDLVRAAQEGGVAEGEDAQPVELHRRVSVAGEVAVAPSGLIAAALLGASRWQIESRLTTPCERSARSSR